MKILGFVIISIVSLGTIITAFVLSFPRKKQVDSATRLKHIRNVSRCVLVFTAFVALYFLVGYFQFFANMSFMSFLKSFGSNFKITVQNHIYTKVADMPSGHLIIFIASTIMDILFAATFFSLFWLYQKGIVFSSKNTRLFYCFAYLIIISWAVGLIIGASGLAGDSVVDLDPQSLFIALLITIIARIMDEGRKIREEQDLTV